MNTKPQAAAERSPTRVIDMIVIHCSATKNGDDLFRGPNGKPFPRAVEGKRVFPDGYLTPVQVINTWHRDRGFSRIPYWMSRQNPLLDAIGYHYVIYLNGAVATGRHDMEVGAHARGYNEHSIGVCMIGTDQYTPLQWARLRDVVMGLIGLISRRRGHQVFRTGWTGKQAAKLAADMRVRILGHRDLSPDKDGDGQVGPHEWCKTCPGFSVAEWLEAGMMPPAGHMINDAPSE